MTADWRDDYFDDDPPSCPHCGGEGYILVCWDDICQGQGYCMHDNGTLLCVHCNGTGDLDGNDRR